MDSCSLLLPSPEACGHLTEIEKQQVQNILSSPVIKKYLRFLHFQALVDLSQNRAITPEEQSALINRFNYLGGMQEVYRTLLSIEAPSRTPKGSQ